MLQGWIVTFMMVERNGGASSGYVASGFFGGEHHIFAFYLFIFLRKCAGLTAGRVILIPINQWVGNSHASA